jgi:UDP-N-acetylglucosamine 2-epimerase (non-hydrolysing)
MAPIIRRLRRFERRAEVKVCVTAQHRDLLDQILRLFEITPDFDLNLMRPGQDPCEVLSRALTGLRDVLREVRPDWLTIQGDTTTTLAAAMAAFHERIPTAHVEAGLRTGNLQAPWPEEMNRRCTTLLAARHFAPTSSARRNLLREGVPAKNIVVTGNTVIDALYETVGRLRQDASLRRQTAALFPFLTNEENTGKTPNDARKLILVTGHRRENFGPAFEGLCRTLAQLSRRRDVCLAWPVHPNPNARGPAEKFLGKLPHAHLLPPLDYLPFVYLMERAYLIVTDSGGVQEEAPALGKPVLVTREVTERPEALKSGTVKLVGTNPKRLLAETTAILDRPLRRARMARPHSPYGDGHAAERIVGELLRAQTL